MSVTVTGISEVNAKIHALVEKKKNRVKTAVKVSGISVLNTVIKSIMTGTKTGITYKRRSVTHTASAAGEAPASDTGDLAGSFISVSANSGYSAVIGASGEQGRKSKWLEFGTANIKPRPHLIPALESNRRHVEKLIKTALK